MNMQIRDETPAHLAKEIRDIWSQRHRQVSILPYNRFESDEGHTWWIVPAPDKVAHQYVKIIFSSHHLVANPDQLFVGLHVEKGVGSALADAGYYKPTEVLRPTWRWHNVLAGLCNGRLRAPVAEASRRLGQAIHIRLDAFVPIRGQSPEKSPHHLVWYESDDGDVIRSSAIPSLKTPERFLRQAAHLHTLRELGQALQTIPDGESVWVDFYIGRSLEMGGDKSALDALQLTDRLLEPFADWVK